MNTFPFITAVLIVAQYIYVMPALAQNYISNSKNIENAEQWSKSHLPKLYKKNSLLQFCVKGESSLKDCLPILTHLEHDQYRFVKLEQLAIRVSDYLVLQETEHFIFGNAEPCTPEQNVVDINNINIYQNNRMRLIRILHESKSLDIKPITVFAIEEMKAK